MKGNYSIFFRDILRLFQLKAIQTNTILSIVVYLLYFGAYYETSLTQASKLNLISGLYNSSFFFFCLNFRFLNKINFHYLYAESKNLSQSKFKFSAITTLGLLFYLIIIVCNLLAALILKIELSNIDWFNFLFTQLIYILGLCYFFGTFVNFKMNLGFILMLYLIPFLLNILNLITLKLFGLNMLIYQPIIISNIEKQFWVIIAFLPFIILVNSMSQKKYFFNA